MTNSRFKNHTHSQETIYLLGATEVEQGNCCFDSADLKASGPMLYTTGLNPCIGLIFSGEIIYHSPTSSEAKCSHFLVLDHNQGLSPRQLLEIEREPALIYEKLSAFCKHALTRMLILIPEEFEDEERQIIKINVKSGGFIRCIQTDLNNPQEALAKDFRKLFSNPKALHQLIKEADEDLNLFDFSHYTTDIIEEPEIFYGTESSAIHLLIKISEGGALTFDYYHSFDTLEMIQSQRKNKQGTHTKRKLPVNNHEASIQKEIIAQDCNENTKQTKMVKFSAASSCILKPLKNHDLPVEESKSLIQKNLKM